MGFLSLKLPWNTFPHLKTGMVCLSLHITTRRVSIITNRQGNHVAIRTMQTSEEQNSHCYESAYRKTNLAKMAQKLLLHQLAKHFLSNQLYTADMNYIDKNNSSV